MFHRSSNIQGSGILKAISDFNAEKRALAIIFLVFVVEDIAIFYDGAYFLGSMTLCVIGLWLLAAAEVLNESDLGLRPYKRLLPLALLIAFWVWTGLSMSWSITIAGSWTEFNRTGGYLAVFIIGLLAGRYASVRRLSACLFLLLTAAAALYALATLALPSLVQNLENIDRVSVPLGYANGLGLFLALGLPLAFHFAAQDDFNLSLRFLAFLAAPLLMFAIFFTLSRGAMIALASGAIVYFAVSPVRLKSLYVLLIVIAPVAVVVNWASKQSALMESESGGDEILAAAAELRIFLLFAVVFLVAGFVAFITVERRVKLSTGVRRQLGAVIVLSAVAVTIFSSLMFVASKPSFTGWVSESYDEMMTTSTYRQGSERLSSMSLGGRYQIWKESINNWKGSPIFGSGAQSFPIVHMMLRESGQDFLKDPHGLFYRMLSDLGLVGFILGVSFVATVIAAAISLLWRVRRRADRSLGASIFSSTFIYLVGTSIDWDWQLFAVTLPYFLFSGILVSFNRLVNLAGASENP